MDQKEKKDVYNRSRDGVYKAGADGDKPRLLYHNDYAPRFREGYNIYDKAAEHMRAVKKGGEGEKSNYQGRKPDSKA